MKKYNLLLILLIIGNSLLAQIQHTVGNVYDFAVGDLFQYSYDIPNQGYGKQMSIIDKYFSTNNDTVRYIIEISTWNADPNTQTTTYNQNIDTVFYTNLDTLVYEPGTVSFENLNCIDSNKVFTKIINPDFEPETTIIKFGIGLGKIQTVYSYSAENSYYNIYLSYYNKGGVSCGNYSSAFESIGIKKIRSDNLNVLVFPNPTNDFVSIISNQDIRNIELFNELGHKVISGYDGKILNLSNLPRGLYTLKIYSQQNLLIKKIIKN